jgi:hypothetical protein
VTGTSKTHLPAAARDRLNATIRSLTEGFVSSGISGEFTGAELGAQQVDFLNVAGDQVYGGVEKDRLTTAGCRSLVLQTARHS